MPETPNSAANGENQLVTVTSSSRLENVVSIAGFLLSFVTALAVASSMIYFHVFLPVAEPSNCVVPRMKPVFNIVPMLLPNEVMNRERLVLGTENYRLQNYLKFAGTSEYAYKYRLLRYTNGNLDGKIYRPTIGKNVVLFLPGHRGHFAQVRSLGSEGSKENTRFSSLKDRDVPDYYVVDFRSEFSAFSAKQVRQQSQFALDCILTIMDLYDFNRYTFLDQDVYDFEGLSALEKGNNTKFVVVGHSMGGYIGRRMLTFQDSAVVAPSIKSVVSLAAPQGLPLLTHDLELNRDYKRTNQFFTRITDLASTLNENTRTFDNIHNIISRQKLLKANSSIDLSFEEEDRFNTLNSISFVSITGGKRDTFIPGRFTSLEGLHSLQVSSNIDQVKRLGVHSIDHQALVWCTKFLTALSQAIFAALVPDFRERSSIARDDKEVTPNELSQQEKTKISKACFDISDFAPNEDCIMALEHQFYANKDNYDAIMRLLTFDKNIGFMLPKTFSAVEALDIAKSLVVTLTPSYVYLTLLFALLCAIAKMDSFFNFGDHLFLMLESSQLSKVFVPVCFALSVGGLFSFAEKLLYYSAVTVFMALVSSVQNGLAIVLGKLLALLPSSFKQTFASSFVVLALSFALFVAYEYYKAVYLPLEVQLSNSSCLITLGFITITVMTTVLLVGQLFTAERVIDSLTTLLAVASLFALLSPLTTVYQNYAYVSDLDEHLTSLFPHKTVDNLVYGPTKRIQATIPDIQELQLTLFKGFKQALREDILAVEKAQVIALALLLPILAYAIVTVVQYDASLSKESVKRKNGKWKQARVEAKGNKKKKKKVQHKFKDNSFIVEGEVLETKKLLNSHLNEIKSNTSEEILLTNDTEYVGESNIVKTSDNEKVQLDSVKGKEKKENDNAIPLFKEGRDIKYRKIEFTVVSLKHPLEILHKKYGASLLTVVEMLAVLVFFLGPTETWLMLPISALLFSVMAVVRLEHPEQVASRKVYTKIEYKS